MGPGHGGSIPVPNSVLALDQGRRISNSRIVGHLRVVVEVIPAIYVDSSFSFFLNKSDQNIICSSLCHFRFGQ